MKNQNKTRNYIQLIITICIVAMEEDNLAVIEPGVKKDN